METERKVKLMWRWSLLTAVVIALFWAIWYLVAGQVPTVSVIQITPDRALQLPFQISRWWDALIGPIWSCLFVLIFTSKRIEKSDDLIGSMSICLIIGLVVGLGVSKYGLDASLIIVTIFSLAVSLAVGLSVGLDTSLDIYLGFVLGTGLGFGLAAGLATGLAAGLATGLVAGLVAGLTAGLVAGLIYLIKFLISRKFWRIAANWLLAR